MQQLIDSKDNGLIKIVTGLRRVGKSYLLKTLFKEYLLETGIAKGHILIIDLEDRRKKAFRDPDYLLSWVTAGYQKSSPSKATTKRRPISETFTARFI